MRRLLAAVPFVLVISVLGLGQYNFLTVKISEVSWGEPDAVEITNFSNNNYSINGWTLSFRIQGQADIVSAPIYTIIPPKGSLYVRETSATPDPPLPLNQPTFIGFAQNLNLSNQAFCVVLKSEFGWPIDEVNVTDPAGSSSVTSFSGFLGHARRGTVATSLTAGSVERIWGIDSERGSDWTEEAVSSFGYENRNSGPRGTDPVALEDIWINEVAVGSETYIELYRSGTPVDVADWFLLVSNVHDGSITSHGFPFTPTPLGGTTPYFVLGTSASPPAELPGGISYFQIGDPGLGAADFTIGVYDTLGRCRELLRATGRGTELVHNEPRLPGHSSLFLGAARRAPGASDVLGRIGLARNGASFAAFGTRTMGLANGAPAGFVGHGDPLDVRLNDGPLHNWGLHFIAQGPTTWQGYTYSIAPSFAHSNGLGPILGLGADALPNFLAFYGVPPITGVFDATGSARFDFDAYTFGFGVDMDIITIVQMPSGALVARSLCLAFDT